MTAPTTLEQMLGIALAKRKLTVGLPAPRDGDKRFPLTPEAAGMLIAHNFVVKMESGAADAIHYDDLRYQQQGVEIVDRGGAFRCDIVITLSALTTMDVRMMKRGALLLTLFDSVAASTDVCKLLLSNHVIALAIDLIGDENGHTPFADILSEISGRAAMAFASALLADSERGKGILLGGIAGIVPCEVTILGSGIDACAAARSAIGLGAVVRMFDNDVYKLRSALRELGPGVMGSALHPRVLLHALQSADVVVATELKPKHVITPEVVAEMKNGVTIFDLTTGENPVFPSLMSIDLGVASYFSSASEGLRVCYVNPGNSVPRTAAMALSNTFLTMISEIFTCDGVTNALMLNEGLQRAALTFLGKPVNAKVAKLVALRQIDIKLILQFS